VKTATSLGLTHHAKRASLEAGAAHATSAVREQLPLIARQRPAERSRPASGPSGPSEGAPGALSAAEGPRRARVAPRPGLPAHPERHCRWPRSPPATGLTTVQLTH
jgi:hypothetical protein